jgi:hypothetical protein
VSTRPRSRRLLLALSILSEEPTRLIALRADGGVLPLRIVASDAHALLAHVPADDAREGLALRLRVRHRDGSGHDIDLAMASAFYHSDGVALARLLVRSVRPASGARAHARTRLDDLALVHVQRASAIASGTEFDVRLVDVGSFGVAFITDADLRHGDRLAVIASVERRMLRLGARVLHTRRAHYGRRRIGCEVLEVTGGERRLLNTLARRFPAAGSPDQRLDAVRRGT